MAKLPKYYKIHTDGCTVELEPIYEELASVVRCEDCIHQRTTDGFYACHKFMGENVSIITNPNNYCSFGRRKENV